MTRQPRRTGVLGQARAVLLSFLVAASAVGIQAIPSNVRLPLDRPAALQPKTAAAVTCTTHPLFTGHLVASSSSTTPITRITSATVYHYISNIDRDWSCDTLFRYSGTAWNTTTTAATYKWGNNINSTSGLCYWVVGTDDYTKANSTSTCPYGNISQGAYAFSLSPQAVYVNDATHDNVYDYSYAHSACDTYLGGSVTKTGASLISTNTDNRPGAANCDPMSFDGQLTAQTVTYDSTAPTTSFTTPTGAAGATVYRTTAGTYNVVRTITEAVSGFSGSNNWTLQRQVATYAAGVCGAFANDGTATTGLTTGSVSTAQTLVAPKCYRWLADAKDLNGNIAGQVTSATVKVDAVAPAASFAAPVTGTTTVLNATSYTVSWSETETDSGLATRSIQRRIATYSAGACGAYANDGSASSATSPIAVSGLVDGKCYQWIQTLTDNAGNQLAVTSGTLRIDIGSPSANFSTPDESTTTIQISTSYSVAWSETAGSGSITARSLQRQKGVIVTPATCAGVTFANDGSPSTSVSSVSATSLVSGNCYRWVQTLTNSNGKSGATTSGSVLVDATAPAGTIAAPEANRPVAGIITITGSATDPGTFRDYTLEFGAGSSPASWTTIATATTQVSGTSPDDVLGSWDTTALAGVYTVRLSIRDWAGNAFQAFIRTFYVENSLRGEESYLERTPFDLGGGWNLAVGVANGEATLSRDLFGIPSYGPAQGLGLTYSSLETTASGRFGYGWSSNLTQFLSFESGFVVWHRADGGRVPFGNVGGTWTPLRGHFETLTTAGSAYTITLKDQTRFVFENSGSGRLKRIENRFGKALTLVWNSSSATATDASGRVMNISIFAAKDRITDVTDSAGRVWTFGYASGNTNDLVSVTDPAGKVTTLAYDGSHRLTTVSRTRTPASGSAVTITWAVAYTSGKATSVTDPITTSVSHAFTYNAGNTVVGLLKEYSPLVRNTWTYAFDDVGLGRPLSITDPEGFVTTIAYDTDSNLAQLVRPIAADPAVDYQTITYTYTNGNLTSETSELDDVGAVVTTKYDYSASNDLTFKSEADGSPSMLVTKYGYDGPGHLTSVDVNCTTSGTTPPGTFNSCTGAGTQDASTNLISSFTYTASDQLQDETDPLGRVTRHAYDTWGNETSITRNYVSGQSATADRNVVTNMAYNQAAAAGKAGLTTATWSPNDPTMAGTPTASTYDALGRLLTEVLPGDASIPGLTRTNTYDELGNLLTEIQSWTGVTRTTTHVYDKSNRETSVTDPANTVDSAAYDAAGNALSSTTKGVTTTRSFDGLDRAVAETVDGAITAHAYDPAGNERQTTDASGVTTNRVFDRAGRLETETVQDAVDQLTTAYTYDALGRVLQVTDPAGTVTSMTYDRPGKTLSTTVDTALSTNAFDRAGNLLSTKDSNGDVTASVVDALDRSIQAINNCTNSGTTKPAAYVVCAGGGTHDAVTNVTSSTYFDAAGNFLAVKDPSGTSSRNFANNRNLSWKSIANCTNTGATPPSDPATCAGTGTADAKTNVTSTTTFDGAGASTLVVNAIGTGAEATTEAALNAAGQMVGLRDPKGTVSRLFYDSSGRVTSTVANCTNTGTTVPTTGWESCAATGTHDATWNVTTSYTYDARGNRQTEAAPNGRVTTFVHDGVGHVLERTENYTAVSPAADQNLTTYTEYDEAGRVKAVRSPTVDRNTFSVTRYMYDLNGRVAAEIRNCTLVGTTPPGDPDWRGCSATFDAGAWTAVGTADADTNIITSYTYDSHGNRLSVTAPDPSDTSSEVTYVATYYAYDPSDRLCRVLEAASTSLQGLAVPCSTAVSGTTTSNLSTRYTYDGVGNLASMVDGRGNTTAYGHDPQGRMTSLTDALSNALSWTYDALGRRTGQANRSSGSITWTYDGAGRILTRAATSVATVQYTYDENGNRMTAYDGTTTITSSFDRLNRPIQVTVSGDSAATTNYTYSFGSPTWSDASGSYTASIDKFGRETSLLDPIHGAAAWTSTYRADGQPATLAAPNGNTTAWAYDEARRPTGSATTAPGPVTRASYTYTLNRAGQRLSENSQITGDPTNGTVNFTYDALGRLAGYSGTPVTSQAYAWDKVPNRTSKQVGGGSAVTMTYNNANRPISDSAGNSYSNDLDGRLTGQIGETLVWDALGRLIQVKDPITSANISTYTYDALDRLLTVSNGAGLTKFRYVGATTQMAQARDLTNTIMYNIGTSLAGGARMDFGPAGVNQRYYGLNGHGDLTWTGSLTGTVSSTLRSDPWGNSGTSSGGALPSFRFQGSWYDISSALSWVVTRWYAPTLGRFVSEDSLLGEIQNPPSRNLYAYAEADPLGQWDPNGQFCVPFGPAAISCIPDAIAIMWAGALALSAWYAGLQTYNYMKAHPVTVQWDSATTQLEAGKKFERAEIIRIRQRWPNWFMMAPKYFWTPWGGRYLDACAYYSFDHFIRYGNHPIMCWEIKSSSSSALSYFTQGYQYDKDLWLMSTYHFPISVIWTTCVDRWRTMC